MDTTYEEPRRDSLLVVGCSSNDPAYPKMGIVCEVMNLLQWITESGIKWPNSNPGIYTRRAHGGALTFRSLWRPRNTPISLHYHCRSLLGSITWQNRGRKQGRFLDEIGDKEYAIALQISRTPMTTYSLVQQTWRPCPQPSVQGFSPPGRPDFHKRRFAERSAILPGQPSNTPVLVCLRCDKKPRTMPTKSSGKKEDMERGAVAGRQKFLFFFLKKKPSAHHPSFCRKRPRAQIPSSSLRRIRLCQTGSSFHPRAASRTLKKCALWIPASDFAVPAGTFWGKLLLRTHKTSSTMAGGSMLWQWSIMSLEKQIPSFKVDPWRWADALISTSGSSLHPFTCGDIHWRKPTLWDFASPFYFGVAFEYPIGKVRYVSQF